MSKCFFGITLFSAVSFLVCSFSSCKSQESKVNNDTNSIVNVVGEIFSDATIDDPGFKICNPQNEIIQYYAFDEKTFVGEKIAIEKTFAVHYKIEPDIRDSGWIRIRFIVNCEGEAGRFRISGMNTNYEAKEFNSQIIDKLLTITKSIDSWKPMQARGKKRDYYQYLLFKIENGKLLEILP